ncbi:MAG TPA: cobalamin-dependent protein [Melioribacteraceae bacterium]|nr:cobalamin-dependent protein [Melioribacteraceae bacterium]
MTITKQTGQIIKDSIDTLTEFIVNKQIELHPHLANYTPLQKRHFYEDTHFHLIYLAEALYHEAPIFFEEYVRWTRVFFASINLPKDDVINNFIVTKEALKTIMHKDNLFIANSYINKAIDIYNNEITESISFFKPDNPLKVVAEKYLAFLLEGNKNDAYKLISDIFENGTSIKDIYIHIFQVTQKEVGRLWQTGKIFVAQEHFITAATQYIMSRFYPHLFNSPKQNKRIVISCVTGELHEMGPRMIADLFELSGWDTYYFGANTPQNSLIKAIQLYKPKVLALSATMTFNISTVEEIILKIKADETTKDTKIIVGGYPFTLSTDLWQKIGADGLAYDFDSAYFLANSFYSN